MNYLSITLSAAGLAFLIGGGGSAVNSKPIILNGNSLGVWSLSDPEYIRSTPIFAPQNTTWRSPPPLEPLPPLPELPNG